MKKPATPETANLTLRVSKEWLDALDAWREAQPVAPTRSQVVKVAVEAFIAKHTPLDLKF